MTSLVTTTKKGKSRSKQLVSSSESDESTPAPKRVKTTEALRIKRISEIEDDISKRMGFKEKRREQATVSHQYGICDQILEEISGLKDRRRVVEKELHDLKKETQSKWYKKKVVKLRSNSESSSSSSITGSMKQVKRNDSEDL